MMWPFTKREWPHTQPGPLSDEEIARLRVSIGGHVRSIENGGNLAEGYNARFLLESSLIQVELLAQIRDELKMLKDEIQLSHQGKTSAWDGISPRP